MNSTELKKELYRQKPVATLITINKAGIQYEATLFNTRIRFLVPLSDIGDRTFGPEVSSQLLIRYIISTNEGSDFPIRKKDIYHNGELIGSQG